MGAKRELGAELRGHTTPRGRHRGIARHKEQFFREALGATLQGTDSGYDSHRCGQSHRHGRIGADPEPQSQAMILKCPAIEFATDVRSATRKLATTIAQTTIWARDGSLLFTSTALIRATGMK